MSPVHSHGSLTPTPEDDTVCEQFPGIKITVFDSNITMFVPSKLLITTYIVVLIALNITSCTLANYNTILGLNRDVYDDTSSVPIYCFCLWLSQF